jgi:hypothetical protein
MTLCRVELKGERSSVREQLAITAFDLQQRFVARLIKCTELASFSFKIFMT